MLSPQPSSVPPNLSGKNGSLSDDPGDFAEQRAFEPQQSASRGRVKLSRGNLLLIGLFAIAGASVYFLSLRNGPAKADAKDQAVEQQVEAFILKTGSAAQDSRSADGKRLVEAFYEDMTRFQVPVESLHSNPFVFGDAVQPTQAATPAETPRRASAEDLARIKRKAEVEAEFAKLKLQGIMMGSDGGTAIVNNEFVSAGQMLGSFAVTKVSPRSVTLMWENTPFTLQIDK